MLPTHALTLRNPWPWFMFHVPTPHRKTIENRSRNLGFHREFWVHCSMSETADDWASACEAAIAAGVPEALGPNPDLVKLTNGRIVARVVCAGRIRSGEMLLSDIGGSGGTLERLREAAQSPWYFGQWGYVIESFTLVKEPVFASGKQGFWRVPEHVLAQLGKAT
jgi:hypothetical protein